MRCASLYVWTEIAGNIIAATVTIIGFEQTNNSLYVREITTRCA